MTSAAPFTLRRAEAADAAAVRALVRDAYARWVPVIGREPRPMTANYETAVRTNRIDLALLAHAETVARAAGHREVRLYTNKKFAANVALYLALGYRIDREEESALGVTVYMSKRIDP